MFSFHGKIKKSIKVFIVLIFLKYENKTKRLQIKIKDFILYILFKFKKK